MRHEMDQKQLSTVDEITNIVLARWTRARALSAAVVTHNARNNKGSVYDILGTARSYERYIETGRVNGNE